MKHDNVIKTTLVIIGISMCILLPCAAQDLCDKIGYTLTATTEITGLTGIEADLIVPDAPENTESAPIWGIFPFIEPVMDMNEPRYGIFQPVLEWDYNHKTKQWTITPWYEDGKRAKVCGDEKNQEYCTCTSEQEQLGNPSTTKFYRTDAPQCHKMCNPKHGQRITASHGDKIHFAITKAGNIWVTTAHNTNTNQQTSFQTTCIQPQDKLKVGFALENSAGNEIRKDLTQGTIFPGNIVFTNIKFTGNTGTVQLRPTVDPTAKACFPWLDIHINNALFGIGSTETITFITQPKNKDEM
jgi:hypothetical protein